MANGQLGQRTPGHRVLLAGGGLARPVERLCGPQVPRYSQHQAPPRFQESRTRLTITGRCTGLLTTFRGSASDTPTRFPRHLSCRQARPAASTAAVNCRQVQQWTEDLAGRLAEHAQGRGARLMSVIREARIGFGSRARGTRAREWQIKRQGGASRCCPDRGVRPREGGPGMLRQRTGKEAALAAVLATAGIAS